MSDFVESVPRLNVEITAEQAEQLQKLIPRGLRGQIFRVLSSDLIRLLEDTTKRELVLAAILNRMINLPEHSLGVSSNESS
jgi:hypothetical protein